MEDLICIYVVCIAKKPPTLVQNTPKPSGRNLENIKRGDVCVSFIDWIYTGRIAASLGCRARDRQGVVGQNRHHQTANARRETVSSVQLVLYSSVSNHVA